MTTTDLFLNPAFAGSVGALALLVAFLLWKKRNPESYGRAKKRVLRFLNTTEQVGYALGFMASLSALAFVAIYFYSEKTVLAVQTSSPEVYTFIAGYILAVQVAGLIFFSLFFLLKMVLHHHNSLDNGIIDDPDVERRFLRTDLMVSQMERNHREEMRKLQESVNGSINEMAEKIVATQKAFYESKGDKEGRLEKNPLPPEGIPERRVIVKNDPSVPVTKEEVIATLLPEILQEITQEGPIASETPEEAKKEDPIPEQETDSSPVKYSKLDEIVLKKLFHMK